MAARLEHGALDRAVLLDPALQFGEPRAVRAEPQHRSPGLALVLVTDRRHVAPADVDAVVCMRAPPVHLSTPGSSHHPSDAR